MFSRHMCQHMGQVPGTSYKLSNSKSLPATLGQSHSRPDAYQMSWGIHGRASPGKPLLPSRVPHQIQILSCCRLDMNRHSGQHNRQDRETCTDAGVGNEVQVYGSKDIIWPLLPRNIHPFSHPPLQLCSTPVQVGTISLECLIQWHLRLIIPQQMQMVWDEVVSNESQQAFQQLPPHLRNDMVQKGNEQGLSVVLLEACGYEDIMGNLLATHHGESVRRFDSHALLHCTWAQSLGPTAPHLQEPLDDKVGFISQVNGVSISLLHVLRQGLSIWRCTQHKASSSEGQTCW